MRIINWAKVARFACERLAAQQPEPIDRFYQLRELASILRPDYRFKWPDMDWWQDAEFNRYLAEFGELAGMNTDRRWMLHELLRAVDSVPGDTAECGVYQGASSYLICQANHSSSASPKCHHLFDSFEGLSQPSDADGAHWSRGDLACGVDFVRTKLRRFPDTQYYPGWIPERFDEVSSVHFSFVHIDVDLYQPTYDSIRFFYPRLNERGILVCDDYGFASCPGATRAIDEYLADKPETVIRLPAGGGLMIKGVTITDVPARAVAGVAHWAAASTSP